MKRSFSPQLDVLDSRIAPSNIVLSGLVVGSLVKTPVQGAYQTYNLSGQADGYVSGLGQVHETINIQESDGGGYPLYNGTMTLSNATGSITLAADGYTNYLYYNTQSSSGSFAGDSASGLTQFSRAGSSVGVPVTYYDNYLYGW
jgi:hypothetical protein